MDKFPNKDKRTLLYVLLGVLGLLVIVAVVGGYFYYINVYKKPVVKTEEKKSTTTSLSEQINAVKLVSTTSGRVSDINKDSITIINTSGTSITLKLSASTSISKGQSLETIKLENIKKNEFVNLSYNNKNLTALNIFLSGGLK
jgi:preprotein translocase subunit YajC